jgi:hypothetical protein
MRCGQEKKPTFAHLLNECTKNLGLMTKRHNRLATMIKKAVVQFVGPQLRSDVRENTTFDVAGLTPRVRNLRPDMIFERSTSRGPVIEVLEFACPYGYISTERDTMKAKFDEKQEKYSEWATEVQTLSSRRVRVSPIIVSSMGAIYGPSLKALKKIFECSDRELRTVGRQMSDTVVMGSMEIWREFVKGQKEDHACEGEERREFEEEVQRLDETEENARGQGRRPRRPLEPGLNEEESDDDTRVELMEDIGELEEEDDSGEQVRRVVLQDPGSDEDGGREEDDGR